MNGKHLEKILQKIPSFVGVFCLDNLPHSPRTRPLELVVNTDPCSRPGEHWLAISLDESGRGEYFDSFGLPPLHSEIIAFMKRNAPNGWTWNPKTFQSLDATTCGMYCALFIKLKAINKDISDVLTSNTSTNDANVSKILMMT